VQRQYSGTAGRVENCQVAVYLTFATTRGYTLIDHALYLPVSWTGDSNRMKAAGVPAEVTFATKPALATTMITRALDAGVEAAWVTGDEVYGNAPTLRATIAGRGLGFVLAIAKTHSITTRIGTRHAVDHAMRPDLHWHRISAGDGAHGPRLYDWAWVETTDPALTTDTTDADADADAEFGGVASTGHDWLLIRRSIHTGELAFYRAHAPHPVTLKTLVGVAGSRWRIEDCFAGAKELTALDHHQVRTWTSWHRWSLLAMIGHAILAVLTADQDPPPTGLTPLTRHEIRRLLTDLTRPARTTEHILSWSIWRRHHQADARASHYRRATRKT
jgi:SRSO17 transposase